jgi:hypothetical protein
MVRDPRGRAAAPVHPGICRRLGRHGRLRRVYQASDRDGRSPGLVPINELALAVDEAARLATTIGTWQEEALALLRYPPIERAC